MEISGPDPSRSKRYFGLHNYIANYKEQQITHDGKLKDTPNINLKHENND